MKQFNFLLKRFDLLRDILLGLVATIAACGFTAACHNSSHPDDKQAVYSALTSSNLASVMVEQDRDKGVIKLTGVVGSADNKSRAEQVAQQSAPGYTIQNDIRVEDAGLTGMAKPGTGDYPKTGKATDTGVPAGAEKTKPQDDRKP